MKRTTRRPSRARWTAACAALVSSGCAADQSLSQSGTGVVDGAITWERPEVGTIYIGGGSGGSLGVGDGVGSGGAPVGGRVKGSS